MVPVYRTLVQTGRRRNPRLTTQLRLMVAAVVAPLRRRRQRRERHVRPFRFHSVFVVVDIVGVVVVVVVIPVAVVAVVIVAVSERFARAVLGARRQRGRLPLVVRVRVEKRVRPVAVDVAGALAIGAHVFGHDRPLRANRTRHTIIDPSPNDDLALLQL